MTDTLTYVYCVVQRMRRPRPGTLPPGIPDGGAVRALDAGGGVWLVVSDVPARRYDEAALAGGLRELEWVSPRALAHHAVIAACRSSRAVLPMQMFTIFRSDERAVAFVAAGRARLDNLLTRLAEKEEWGVRVSAAPVASDNAPEWGARPAHPRSGADYLARKRDALQGARQRARAAVAAADRLYDVLAREANDARRRPPDEQSPGTRLLLDAAFLVPRSRRRAFRTLVRRYARTSDAGVSVTLTGPWPPYSFVDAGARGRAETPGREGRRREGRPAARPVREARDRVSGSRRPAAKGQRRRAPAGRSR